jgi:aryl-alcohol dehydrogenase-like predicted oxidoreductase
LDSLAVAKNIDVVQFPFNLLDNNSRRKDILSKLKYEGKMVQTRSCFLQGLFFMDINKIPNSLLSIKDGLECINLLSRKYQISIREMALCYSLRNPNIDSVLIGVESVQQLMENLQFSDSLEREDLWNEIDEIHIENSALLNPSLW